MYNWIIGVTKAKIIDGFCKHFINYASSKSVIYTIRKVFDRVFFFFFFFLHLNLCCNDGEILSHCAFFFNMCIYFSDY